MPQPIPTGGSLFEDQLRLSLNERVATLTVTLKPNGDFNKSPLKVMHVEPNGPADQAGVQEEDHILAIGDEPVASVDDLHRLLTQLPIEVPATITLLRGQRRLERMILPQEYPHPAPAA